MTNSTDIDEIMASIEAEVRDFGEAIDLELEAADLGDDRAAQHAADMIERMFVDLGSGLEAYDAWSARQAAAEAQVRRLVEHYKAQLDAVLERQERAEAAVLRVLVAAAEKKGLKTLTGEHRIRTARINVGLAATPARLVLDKALEESPELLPREFQRRKVEADKAAIKAAIKAGTEVRGAELVTGVRIDRRAPRRTKK